MISLKMESLFLSQFLYSFADYGYLIVASDGVFEKMDEDLVCKYAEDTRTMEGRITDSNQWMMPIALGGQTVPTNMYRSMEENEHCLDDTHFSNTGSGDSSLPSRMHFNRERSVSLLASSPHRIWDT